MKRQLIYFFLGLGWIFLFLLIGSTYVFNKFSNASGAALFSPIAWEDHQMVFEGAISCSLTDEALAERKAELRQLIFPKVKRKVELRNGYIYYFDDEPELAATIMEFINKEKQCCPFFKFDFSILPFEKGLALQLSGSEEIKVFLDAFEEEI